MFSYSTDISLILRLDCSCFSALDMIPHYFTLLIVFFPFVCPGSETYCGVKWNFGTWYRWWSRCLEKQTWSRIQETVWIFTSSHPGAAITGKRPTWKCSSKTVFHFITNLVKLGLLLLSWKLFLTSHDVVFSGCQNWNRKNAYCNGRNRIREKKSRRKVQGHFHWPIPLLWVSLYS